YFRQVHTGAVEVRMRLQQDHRQSALRGTNIGERVISVPGKDPGESLRGPHAQARHGLHEAAKRFGVEVRTRKRARPTVADFVLRLTRAKTLRQVSPERIESRVGHIEEAPDVGLLVAIKEQIRLESVGVFRCGPIVSLLQETEGDQRVQKVCSGPRMQGQSL